MHNAQCMMLPFLPPHPKKLQTRKFFNDPNKKRKTERQAEINHSEISAVQQKENTVSMKNKEYMMRDRDRLRQKNDVEEATIVQENLSASAVASFESCCSEKTCSKSHFMKS